MRDLASVMQLQNHDNLIIELTMDAKGNLSIRSIEVNDSVSNVRFSFKYDALVSNVLSTAAANAFAETVAMARTHRGTMVVPDLHIVLTDLLLRGCRIIVSPSESGSEKISLKFDHFEGRVQSLFKREEPELPGPPAEAIEQAVFALEQVYRPLRNFSQNLNGFLDHSPHLLNRDQLKFLRQIRGEIEQMSYFTDAITEKVNATKARHDELFMIMNFDQRLGAQ